ncbi:MAG: c-type cytochrome [Planctomycetota bacterium]
MSAVLAAGLVPATPAQQLADSQPASAAELPGRALFLQACATCHGADGGGQGSVTLDRPARSFRDGGFSFGNTNEALFRTISTGIPGSPMPGFESAYSETQRRELAEFVRSLGPAETAMDPDDAILVVRDQPQVARGILPPIAEGLPLRPRGLLLGTLDGLSFEYCLDDLRLLGVRQGDFVRRADWTGRGGQALEPLGRLVWLDSSGSPTQHWLSTWAPQLVSASTQEQGEPVGPTKTEVLRARLTDTRIQGDSAALHYELFRERSGVHERVARVEESVRAETRGTASGFTRQFQVELFSADTAVGLVTDVLHAAAWEVFRTAETGPAGTAGPTAWSVQPRPDGTVQLTGLSLSTDAAGSLVGGWIKSQRDISGVWFVPTEAKSAPSARGSITILLAPSWNPELEAVFRQGAR